MTRINFVAIDFAKFGSAAIDEKEYYYNDVYLDSLLYIVGVCHF